MYAIILGSGLTNFLEGFQIKEVINYEEITLSGLTPVEGHQRALVVAEFEGHSFLVFSGKYHYYEGDISDLWWKLFLFAQQRFGLNTVVSTATSGAFGSARPSGFWYYIDRLLAVQPSKTSSIQSSKFNTSDAFSALKRACYAFQTGPSFGTTAEYQMLINSGAHLVGMSLFPEHRILNSLGIRHHCLSWPVVDYFPLHAFREPSHSEVIQRAEEGGRMLQTLFISYLKN